MVVLLLIILVTLTYIYKDAVSQGIEAVLEWVRVHKVLGPIFLTLIYIVTTVIFIPGSLLAFGTSAMR